MNLPIFLLIELFTFCLVVFLSRTAMRWAESYWTVRRRLRDQHSPEVEGASSLIKTEAIRNPFLQWVQSATSLNDADDRNRLRRDLARAGHDHPAAPIFYVLIRFSLAIGLPIALVLSQAVAAKPLGGTNLVAGALLLCGLGLVAPRLVIDNHIKSRKSQIEQEFPDALDLMVVCVEAGLGVEAAFVRVAQEVRRSHPRIAEEFGRMADELSAGRSRVDALRAMGERVDVDQIKSFVALLIQTDALGVSIGQTLRTYSDEMREHRFLRGEEKAMRIPVLMTVPLVLCILPVIVTVALLPTIIDMIRIVIPTLKGMH